MHNTNIPKLEPLTIEQMLRDNKDAGTWKTDAEIRIKCLELAVTASAGYGNSVELAKEFYEFVLNNQK